MCFDSLDSVLLSKVIGSPDKVMGRLCGVIGQPFRATGKVFVRNGKFAIELRRLVQPKLLVIQALERQDRGGFLDDDTCRRILRVIGTKWVTVVY